MGWCVGKVEWRAHACLIIGDVDEGLCLQLAMSKVAALNPLQLILACSVAPHTMQETEATPQEERLPQVTPQLQPPGQPDPT